MASTEASNLAIAEQTGSAAAEAHPVTKPTASTFVAEWADDYPTGVPHNYKMVHEGTGKRPSMYVENHLSTDFYTDPPKNIKAVFSTDLGTSEPRTVTTALESRKLRLWNAETIQKYANSVRKKFWMKMRDMERPQEWDDLLEYYDTYDIYYHGALNIWNLLNHLWNENNNLRGELAIEATYEISIWVDNWMQKDDNEEKLRNFQSDDILNVLEGSERDEVKELKMDDASIVRAALSYRQEMIRKPDWPQHKAYPQNVLGSHWTYENLSKWLVGEPVFTGRGALPPIPLVVDGSSSRAAERLKAAKEAAKEMTNEVTKEVAPNADHATARGSAQQDHLISENTRTSQAEPGNSGMQSGAVQLRAPMATHPGFVPAVTLPPQAYAPTVAWSPANMPLPHPARPHLLYNDATHGQHAQQIQASVPHFTGQNGMAMPYNAPIHHAPTYGQQMAIQPPVYPDQQMMMGGSFHSPGQHSARKHFKKTKAFQKNAEGSNNVPASAMGNQDSRRFVSTSQAIGHSTNNNAGPSRNFTSQPLQKHNPAWSYQGEDLHGPSFRRSPPQEENVVSNGFVACANSGNVSIATKKWEYVPCNCNACQQRNRSVYVCMRPIPDMTDPKAIEDSLRRVFSAWGVVDGVVYKNWKGQSPDLTNGVLIRFQDKASALRAVELHEFYSDILGCSVSMNATHNSEYGAEQARRKTFVSHNPLPYHNISRQGNHPSTASFGRLGNARHASASSGVSTAMPSPAMPPNFQGPHRPDSSMVQQLRISSGFVPSDPIKGLDGMHAPVSPAVPEDPFVSQLPQPKTNGKGNAQQSVSENPEAAKDQDVIKSNGTSLQHQNTCNSKQSSEKSGISRLLQEDWRSKPPSDEVIETPEVDAGNSSPRSSSSRLSDAVKVKLPASPPPKEQSIRGNMADDSHSGQKQSQPAQKIDENDILTKKSPSADKIGIESALVVSPDRKMGRNAKAPEQENKALAVPVKNQEPSVPGAAPSEATINLPGSSAAEAKSTVSATEMPQIAVSQIEHTQLVQSSPKISKDEDVIPISALPTITVSIKREDEEDKSDQAQSAGEDDSKTPGQRPKLGKKRTKKSKAKQILSQQASKDNVKDVESSHPQITRSSEHSPSAPFDDGSKNEKVIQSLPVPTKTSGNGKLSRPDTNLSVQNDTIRKALSRSSLQVAIPLVALGRPKRKPSSHNGASSASSQTATPLPSPNKPKEEDLSVSQGEENADADKAKIPKEVAGSPARSRSPPTHEDVSALNQPAENVTPRSERKRHALDAKYDQASAHSTPSFHDAATSFEKSVDLTQPIQEDHGSQPKADATEDAEMVQQAVVADTPPSPGSPLREATDAANPPPQEGDAKPSRKSKKKKKAAKKKQNKETAQVQDEGSSTDKQVQADNLVDEAQDEAPAPEGWKTSITRRLSVLSETFTETVFSAKSPGHSPAKAPAHDNAPTTPPRAVEADMVGSAPSTQQRSGTKGSRTKRRGGNN